MRVLSILCTVVLAVGCNTAIDPDGRGEQTGYRSGTAADDYSSNGERGNVSITEIFWSGSVRETANGFEHDPTDIFIELQNKHPRPVYLKGWLLKVEAGHGDEGLTITPRAARSERCKRLPPELQQIGTLESRPATAVWLCMSMPCSSRKCSATVNADNATRARAPGGSFI